MNVHNFLQTITFGQLKELVGQSNHPEIEFIEHPTEISAGILRKDWSVLHQVSLEDGKVADISLHVFVQGAHPQISCEVEIWG